MKTLRLIAAVAALVALIAIGAAHAGQTQKLKMSKMPPTPQLKTTVLGGVEPSAEELAAMQKGNYLLHARNAKLTKVQAEKSRLPLDPKGHAQVTYTAQSPKDKNTIYVNQGSIICKTTDGGKTWTSYPRTFGEHGTGHFKILSDGTFISVWSQQKGPAEVMVSSDEGRTWKKITEIPVEVPGFTFNGRGQPLHRLPDDTLLWFTRFDAPISGLNYNWYSMSFIYRSEDGGKSWSGPHEYHEHVFEGGMAQLPSGRLFATVRYQRPVWPGDPDNILELCQGGSPNLGPRTPFKHVFLLESDDKGRTWKNFRQLTTDHGQCYGSPAALSDGTVVVVTTNGYNPRRSGLAMISRDDGKTWEDEAYYVYAPGVTTNRGNIGYSQSVLIEDDLILTIAGTTDTAGRNSHAANIGNSDLTAIRWKPERQK